MVKRGEIWWCELDGGARPVLVLTRAEAIPLLTKVVCATITSRIRSVPSELPLGVDDGMPRECVASFDNVATVAKSDLKYRISAISPQRLPELCETLNIALGC